MSTVVAMWNRLFRVERAPIPSARPSAPEGIGEPRREYIARCTERSLDLVLRAGERRRAAERSESRRRFVV